MSFDAMHEGEQPATVPLCSCSTAHAARDPSIACSKSGYHFAGSNPSAQTGAPKLQFRIWTTLAVHIRHGGVIESRGVFASAGRMSADSSSGIQR